MKSIAAIFAIGLLAALPGNATVSIVNLNETSIIDFQSFTGSGFAPTPSVGQLDSDTWRVLGLDDGNTTFGGTHTSGDFARGTSAGGVTTGGVYAFTVGTGNTALGVQPGGTDFTPGSFVLRIQNNTGGTVSSWNLSYDLFVLNDQGRSNSLDWEWSTNDTNYTSLSTYTSVEAAATGAAWANVQSPVVNGLNATVTDGGFLYLRWIGDDVGGSGSRDEFAIDNISITAVPEPSAALLCVFGCAALLRRRR